VDQVLDYSILPRDQYFLIADVYIPARSSVSLKFSRMSKVDDISTRIIGLRGVSLEGLCLQLHVCMFAHWPCTTSVDCTASSHNGAEAKASLFIR
jgi:hypothetical protein